MSMIVKISTQGQITLPKAARKFLQLEKGDEIEITQFKDHIGIFKKTSTAKGLRGMLSDCVDEPLTLQDMQDAIKQGALKAGGE